MHISEFYKGFFNRLVALAVLVCVSLMLYAGAEKTVYSRVTNSSWTNSGHWSATSGGPSCSCSPDESKDVIYVESNTSAASGLTFGSTATLIIRCNATLTINGNTQFNNGSQITVEAGSSLVINGNLVNANNSDQVIVDGTLTINGNFTAGNGSTVVGDGSLTTSGSAVTEGTAKVFGYSTDCTTGPCYSNSVTALPVELIEFLVKHVSGNAELSWSTASEKNSDYFLVQKSVNGIDFTDISKLKAAGNSNQLKQYSFTDKNLAKGTFYYRLKQVDTDGRFEYFEIRALSNYSAGDDCDITIKPNPCVGRCEISFENCSGQESSQTQIAIFDALGNVVHSFATRTVENGEAHYEFTNDNYLKPAVYIVRGQAGNTQKSKQIILNR